MLVLPAKINKNSIKRNICIGTGLDDVYTISWNRVPLDSKST